MTEMFCGGVVGMILRQRSIVLAPVLERRLAAVLDLLHL